MKAQVIYNLLRHSAVACALCACAALAFVCGACSKDNETKTAADQTVSHKLETQALDLSGVDKEKFDLNGDGKDDQVRYIVKGKGDTPDQLKYVTHDINFDGINDITEFYENGERVRDEIDLDYDGVCDLIVHYKNGVVTQKEYSVDFEGKRYGVQIYDENGNLVQVMRDTNNDGTLDVVENYKPGEQEPYSVSGTIQ